MYTLGIGIGILGMSYNLGGIFKKVFENRYAVLFSNFSFSIYITHMSFPLMRHSYVLPDVDYFVVVKDYIFVIPASLAFGILITLVIEEPLLSIQKKIVPQIKKYDGAENKNN
ncbi:unnamed protein product [Psylliodes chrysocephalus]|uniref:Uncharacterized protein n=1 Tax=Psylliodes chrysocephalus TaxID=3402493 RepID=A0A9P0D231_9CUCU|nr:unnamed protein product [Psylliodes chrysocephala]